MKGGPMPCGAGWVRVEPDISRRFARVYARFGVRNARERLRVGVATLDALRSEGRVRPDALARALEQLDAIEREDVSAA